MNLKIIGAIVLLLTVAVLAQGDCFVRNRVVVQHHAQVVTPVAVATFVPFAVPVYSITYTGDQNAALVQEVQQLRRELQQFRQPQQQQPAQQAPAPQFNQAPAPPPPEKQEQVKGNGEGVQKIFAAKCAQCHDKLTANKGGGFALLDGQSFGKLDFKQVARIGSKVYTGAMPPGKDKLTDQEVGEVMQWLDGLK